MPEILTPRLVRRLIDYDPDTGHMAWKVRGRSVLSSTDAHSLAAMARFNSRWAGTPALASINAHGYRHGSIMGRTYTAHRVAMCIYHNRWPADLVDHINGIKSDNRIENLRFATRSDNQRNCKRSSRNKSGFTGVAWHASSGKWHAYIFDNGQSKSIGYFDCKQQAVDARKQEAARLGFHENHGRDPQ